MEGIHPELQVLYTSVHGMRYGQRDEVKPIYLQQLRCAGDMIRDPTSHKGPVSTLLDAIIISKTRRYLDVINE